MADDIEIHVTGRAVLGRRASARGDGDLAISGRVGTCPVEVAEHRDTARAHRELVRGVASCLARTDRGQP